MRPILLGGGSLLEQFDSQNPRTSLCVRMQVKYSHFLHHLLTFQLSGHRAFLQKFYTTFQIHDKDSNGVLNEDQMRMLVRDVDPSKQDHDIDGIINKVDPYNNQNITYSECVNVLSTELVNSMQRG